MTHEVYGPLPPKFKIAEICDERSNGDGWFVYLARGWQLDGAHCFGEDTKPAIYRTMKRVTVCACEECSR